MAITLDVGKIKLVWRATYAGGTAYAIDDLVQYDDGSTNSAYICVAATTGNVPSTTGTVDTTYWNLMAKGATASSSGVLDGEVQLKSGVGFGASTKLFYDSTNSRLGIGTTAPTTTLEVAGVMTSTNLVVSGITTFVGVTTYQGVTVFGESFETTQYESGAANSTTNIDILSGSCWFFASNSGGTWTHNLRGDGSTTLASIMHVGSTLTYTCISKQSNTSYYTADIDIDGNTSQTVNWLAGAAPTAGKSGSNYDVYTFVITRHGTGATDYKIMGSQCQFGA